MSSAYIRFCLRPFKPNLSHTLNLLDGIFKKKKKTWGWSLPYFSQLGTKNVSDKMVKWQLNLPKQNTDCFHKYAAQFSIFYYTRFKLSCSLQVYCAKIQNFINNSFQQGKVAVHNMRRGLILLKQTENSLYKKVNNKTQSYKKITFLGQISWTPQHTSTLQYDWLKCNFLFLLKISLMT
jgi:hypothetical protein